MSFLLHAPQKGREQTEARPPFTWLESVALPLAISVMEAQPIGMVLAFATFVVTGSLTAVPLAVGHIALLMLGLLWWAMSVEYLQRIGRLQTSHIIAGLHLCSLLVAWVLLIEPLLPALSQGSSIPLALFDLIFLFWLWRRSLSRARSGFAYDALARSFKVA